MRRALFSGVLVFVAAACVPADHALPLGSVEFTIRATAATREGFGAGSFGDAWNVTVDRAIVSFKTMTIGENDDPDRCSYRGRGAQENVVFDVREGNVQTFNGVLPSSCPDVGVVLGPPDDATVPGAGATAADILALLEAPPAHAIVELTATRRDERYRVRLRFATETTSSRFGGCQASTRGVIIKPNARLSVAVPFTADPFFRQGFGEGARLLFAPFKDADALGDADGVVTMQELDALPIASARVYSDLYKLHSAASTPGSFGDYVREEFKSVFLFGDGGFCNGNDPGAQ